MERANLLIEQAEAIGEPPEDPLLLYSVLVGYASATGVAGNVRAYRDVADRILALAEKQEGLAPLIIGHVRYGWFINASRRNRERKRPFRSGDRALRSCRASLASALWPRPGVLALVFRSIVSWMLGYPEAALADADRAVKDARATGHAASLMFALSMADLTHMLCGNYAAVSECMRELAALADEKGSLFWKTVALSIEARHLAPTGDPANSLPMMISARNAYEATGANFLAPLDLSILASTHAALGKFDDARRYIAKAMTTMETNNENGLRPTLFALPVKSRLSRRRRTLLKPKPISSGRLQLPANSKPNPGNFAPQ